CLVFSSRRRHTRSTRDWSSDVCSSDLIVLAASLIRPASTASSAGDANERSPRDRGALALPLVNPRIVVSKSKRELHLYSAGRVRSEEGRVGKEGGCRGVGGRWSERLND